MTGRTNRKNPVKGYTDAYLQKIQAQFCEFVLNLSDPVSIWRPPDKLNMSLPIEKQIDMLYQSVCIDVNQAAWKAFRINTKADIIGNKYINLAGDRTDNDVFADFIKNEYSLQNHHTYKILKDGSEFFGLENWYGIVEKKKLKFFCIYARDNTKCKMAERIVSTRLHGTDDILDCMLNGFLMIDPNGRIIRANAAYCNMTGYTESELLRMNISDLEVGTFRKNTSQGVQKMGKLGSARFEARHKHKNGKLIDLDVNIVIIRSDNNTIVAAFLRDITADKLAEEALRNEKYKAQKYLDIAGSMIVALDKKGNVTLINRKGSDIIGYDQKEIIGKNWFDNFIKPEVIKDVKKVFNQLMKGEIKTNERFENTVLTRGGNEKLIAWHNAILRDDHENIVGTLSSGEDITEQKKSEQQLKKYKDHLEKLVGERTSELEKSNRELIKRTEELEAFNKVMIDRETRIIEMKNEVNALCKALGRKIKYPPVWEK